MKLEELTQTGAGRATNSELFQLRLRAIQLHNKYLEVEKREPLINIDWDSFYNSYKFLTHELNKRNLNFTRRNVDKVLEKSKYFGIKIIEKSYKSASKLEKCFAMLAQIGQSNILINPTISKEQIKETINGIIVTKSDLMNWERIKSYQGRIPIYATGKAFDRIDLKEKHLFIKSLEIGTNQVLIRPIKITYKKKSPAIGLRINKKDTKLSILPEFLTLTKSAQDLIKGTVWICEVEKYDKDDNDEESICFLSLIEFAKALKPEKIFIVNVSEDLLKHKEVINQELKKWQGRILCDGDTLEEDEIMKGLVWEINESEENITSSDILDSFVKFADEDRVIAEVNFNGVRARIEKKKKDVIIMVNPNKIEGSPLQSKKLSLQVDEIQSFRDDFIGDGTIVMVDDEKNECLGEEVVDDFLAKKSDYEAEGKSVHIFISDLFQLNGRDIGEWTLEKRKKTMNYFGNREHVHFVKAIPDTEKNSLSYIINVGDKKEIKKIFDSIMRVSEEGKFYPKNIAKGVIVKCSTCPYLSKRVNISKPETTESYHHIPVKSAELFVSGSFRTINLSETKGIKAVIGKLKSDPGGSTKVQKYLFDINKWTMETAKAWVKEQVKKSMHKRTECMECSKPPVYECLWAEGMGHAWFCKEHFKEWATNGDGKDEIISVKEVKDGEAVKKFGNNTNPNIWDELKAELEKADEYEFRCVDCGYKIKSTEKTMNEKCPECGGIMRRVGEEVPGKSLDKVDEEFKCQCISCGYIIESVVHCINIRCLKCGSQMRRVGRPGSGKPEEHLNKSDVKFEFKKTDEEFIVGGIVYHSKVVDSQGHFSRQGEVWKALKLYMRNKGNIKIMHKGEARNIPIIESYLVEENHHKGGSSDKYLIEKGDWWLSVYLGDKENLDIWQDVKSGKLSGWSMAGSAHMSDKYI